MMLSCLLVAMMRGSITACVRIQWLMTWCQDASLHWTWAFASSHAQFLPASFSEGRNTRNIGRSPSLAPGRASSMQMGFKVPSLERKKSVHDAYA
ncbi:hypothetical protein M758_UG301400 [Ceratodon purpureus]|nr:hypothetical protein M758_UG301400 [Ceratodon purpureus]